MRLYDAVVCLPRGIASVEFEKAFGYPGKVITSEYLLLAGPYGKYLLEDCFHPEVQVVVFEYLDLLGLMWEKTITDSDLRKLECRLSIVLTMMEVLLPAWELDLNWHHMVQGVPFSTTKTEGKKRSRESVVLMKDNNKYWAGRVAFS